MLNKPNSRRCLFHWHNLPIKYLVCLLTSQFLDITLDQIVTVSALCSQNLFLSKNIDKLYTKLKATVWDGSIVASVLANKLNKIHLKCSKMVFMYIYIYYFVYKKSFSENIYGNGKKIAVRRWFDWFSTDGIDWISLKFTCWRT